MLGKNNKNQNQSFQAEFPFLQKKKVGAEAYVSERINRMRQERAKARDNTLDNSASQNFQRRWKDKEYLSEIKKHLLVSANTVVSTEQILSNFQSFRKQIEALRKKTPPANYEDILSNLHPLSNAIKQLSMSNLKKEQKKKMKLKNPGGRMNLYKSISKKLSHKEETSYTSEKSIKMDEGYFLNVGKMSLLKAQQRVMKKNQNSYTQSVSKYQIQFALEEGDNEEIFANRKVFKMNQTKPMREIEEEEPDKVQLQTIDDSLKLPQIPSKNILKVYSPPKKRYNKKFQPNLQTYYYRSLLWKVNYSNNLYIQIPNQYQHRLRVFVGKGNNSGLVRGLIKRRIWFAVTDRIEQANFVWTQLKSLPYLKLQNQSEDIPIQAQANLSEFYAKDNKLWSQRDIKTFKKYMQIFQSMEEKADERLLCRNKFFTYEKSLKAQHLKGQKMSNHLINNYLIGNKKALFHTMSAYYAEKQEDVFDYLPLTFHVKEGLEDKTYFKFLKYYYKRAKQTKQGGKKPNNIWIVKPGENSNRGSGIKVCLNIEEIKNILKKRELYSDGTYRTWIIQYYIDKPLLYHKRKFDIRHYMMITCVNGVMKGYWYRDGYVRTTSSEYNLSTNCSKIHLTNDAIQKNLPDYGKYEKGNKLSYDELENYIGKVSSKKKNSISFKDEILPKMKKIGTDAIRACSGSIDPHRLENNFQIFGLDFMIDSQFNLYLIQINTNPCLELSCPLLCGIIPRFIENTLELTLDCQFPPPVRYYPKGMHYFKNLEDQNRYELVYDSRAEKLYTCGSNVLDQKLLQEEDDTFEDDGDEFDDDD